MTPTTDLIARLKSVVDEFDEEVAEQLSIGERADLWTDVEVPVAWLREAADALAAQEAELARLRKFVDLFLCIDFEYPTEHDDALLESVIEDARALSGGGE